MEEHIVQPRDWKLTAQLAGITFVIVAIVLLLSRIDVPTCLFFSSVAAFALGWQGPAIVEAWLPQAWLPQGSQVPQLPQRKIAQPDTYVEEYTNEQERDEACFTFSQVLGDFNPSLRTIYLGSLPDGSAIYSDARGLCHVALAGATGGGKSSIIRLLISQLCKAGASVLLLNPHYTHFDLDAEEDWTPFEPYLVHDPMECRKYEVIEHYLKQVATVLLPKRLEKYAHSQPTGKPYFLVIDELPAIVDNVPNAPKYIAKILREGRKVGILLVTAAQDFLVKTIAPQGGGAIRDCYRTAFYVGGDPTTARVLLDLPANQIQEDTLGKGIVMLRSQNVKQARVVDVPYVDNQALYTLLGPSTYTGYSIDDEDDMFLENLQPKFITLPPAEQVLSKPSLPSDLQRAFDAYMPGMTYRQLGEKIGVNKDKAGSLIRQLQERRLIN